MPRYINPYTDFGFRRLFGTEPNKAILIAFLNALFEEETDPKLEKHVITDLNYLPGEYLGILETDRRAVFDVYCETAAGKKIIVEMQNSYQHSLDSSDASVHALTSSALKSKTSVFFDMTNTPLSMTVVEKIMKI